MRSSNDAEKYINSAAISLLHKFNDNTFKNDLNNLVDEEFDGDFNTLFWRLNDDSNGSFKTDIENNYSSNVTLVENAIDSGNVFSSELNPGVPTYYNNYYSTNSFIADIIDGIPFNVNSLDVEAYPQVFIYDYEDLKSNSGLLDTPTIAVGYTDENDELFGYKLLSNGEIEIVVVDSIYAENNLVWVISFNETAATDAHVDSLYSSTIFDGTITMADTGATDTVVLRSCIGTDPVYQVSISEICLEEDLESWFSGKSDVSVIYCHIDESSGYPTDVVRIILNGLKVRERDLNKWLKAPVLKLDNIQDKMDPCENIDFTLYEHDFLSDFPGNNSYYAVYDGTPGSCIRANDENGNDLRWVWRSVQSKYFVDGQTDECSLKYDWITDPGPGGTTTYTWSGDAGQCKISIRYD